MRECRGGDAAGSNKACSGSCARNFSRRPESGTEKKRPIAGPNSFGPATATASTTDSLQPKLEGLKEFCRSSRNMWRSIRERSSSHDRKTSSQSNTKTSTPTGSRISLQEEKQLLNMQIASLHDEMKSLRVECDRLTSKHLKNESAQAETSSAYNTGGESCRSVSVTPEDIKVSSGVVKCFNCAKSMTTHPSRYVDQHPGPSNPANPIKCGTATVFRRTSSAERRQRNATQHISGLPVVLVNSAGTLVNIPPMPITIHTQPERSRPLTVAEKFRIPKVNVIPRTPSPTKNPISKREHYHPAPVQHANDRIRHRLFMFDKPIDEVAEWSDETEPDEEIRDDETLKGAHDAVPVEYKWKVKRRCDGTRYVVKRPIRNQVLKKREAQLLKERAGVSTDDDALSGVKLGHFMRRDERKRQLEHERRSKLKHELALSSRAPQTDSIIVDLAKSKMARRRGPLDGFVSTREYLSQRHDSSSKQPPPVPILAVTTV